MMRPSVILASLLFSHASPASVILSDSVEVSPKSIVQVVCPFLDKDKGFMVRSGTAFRVGRYLISVNHVVSPGQCWIGSDKISIIYKSAKTDFAMLDSGAGPFIRVDCGGFVKDRKYLAIGFARGEGHLTQVELTATGETDRGQAVLTGMVPVIPGMSGGVVLDEATGEAVGTVNAENFEEGLSWSVPLSSTPVCRKAVA